ncbi:MAG: N-acetylmuramoyl-L-alanine amidase [bacterium]
MALKCLKKKIRIVIDAGHGGKDSGANGVYSLKEKDITLDIARRAKAFLKKDGLNVYLTRNDDKDVSLLERSDFANHLKADLFVSIHVNSAGISQNANGLETYYWGDKNIEKPGARNGFLSFLQNKSNQDSIQLINKYFYEKDLASKNLASCIHNGILNFVNERGFQVYDRGLKKDWFRIHLFNDALTALVEVGFLTNPKEAKHLADYKYRNILAYGISQGVKNYILEKQ